MVFNKKYRGLLILIFLLGGLKSINAQSTIGPVSIRCVSIDSAGDITLTWVLPANMNGAFQSFTIDTSTNNTTYAPIATITITNPTQTSITIPAATFPLSPNTTPVYFTMYTNTSNGSVISGTVSTIYLYVINQSATTGIAELEWNAIQSPLPQGSDKWYYIYREYNHVWTFIDSTQSLSYLDTITYCDDSLKYKVEIADSTICTSSSNQAGNGLFHNKFPPPQAIIDTVSVNSVNNTVISWSRSPKNQVIGYIIYVYNSITNGFDPKDTVYGINNTSFIYLAGNPSDSSLSFEIAALDSCGQVGGLSNSQHTILLKEKPDICEQTMTLTWNSYANLAGHIGSLGIGGYKIFVRVNSGPFQYLATTPHNVTTYVDSNLNTHEYRCYFVQVFDSAHVDTTASSNIVCDSIESPAKPRNNYLRTATVILNNSAINVVGYMDSISGAGYYEFQRAADTGKFVGIDTVVASHHTDSVNYIDNTANPSVKSYRYRIVTLDSCKQSIDTTNIGETMYLTAVGQPDEINILTWNDYRDWYANPVYYLIYRSEDGVNYILLNNIPYTNAGQNTYSDDVTSITNGQGAFYYYIKAVEYNAGKYMFTDTSYSNIAIAYQDPIVYIPDAFCPNGKNKIFKPEGVFINIQGYDFSIFDRWGYIIFETNDPNMGWNGTYKGGGKVLEEDTYIYVLTYTSSKGEYFQRKGSVALLK